MRHILLAKRRILHTTEPRDAIKVNCFGEHDSFRRILCLISPCLGHLSEKARWLIDYLFGVQTIKVCIGIRDNRELAKALCVNGLVLSLEIIDEESAEIYSKCHEAPLHLPCLSDGNGPFALLSRLLNALQVAHPHDMIARFDFVLAFSRALKQVKRVIRVHLAGDLLNIVRILH